MNEQEKRMMRELLWTLCEELNNNASWLFDGRAVSVAQVDESHNELCISFNDRVELVLTGMVRLTRRPMVDHPPCTCEDREPHFHLSLFDIVPADVMGDALEEYRLNNPGVLIDADLKRLVTKPLGASVGTEVKDPES